MAALSDDQFGEALSDQDRAVLDFEAEHASTVPGIKESRIRAQFKQNWIQYHQRLNQIIDSPHAMAYNPVVVNRIRDVRASRWGRAPGGR